MIIKYYKMVTETAPEALTDEVNKWLKQGWQPYGSPSAVVTFNNTVRYMQAMVY